jgi:hypothetical protein
MKEINISDNGEIKEVQKNVTKTTAEQQKQKPNEIKNTEVAKKEKPAKNKESEVSIEKTHSNTKVEIPKGSIEKKKGIILLTAIGLILILGIAAFYYFGIYKYNPRGKDDNIVNLKTNYILSQSVSKTFANLLVNKPEEPRTEESPINGLLFTKKEMDELKSRRPVAVMINNHADSRPQSGLTSADIVYETLAEGGITRYMAFFWSQGPEKVGSIRSARQYYLEWLSPYDPLYIHIGWADTNNPRTDAKDNIIAYNLKDVGVIGYWQWIDSGRYAPHDKYNSIPSAWDYAKTRDWDGFPSNLESWKFKNDLDPDLRGDGYRYKIVFHKSQNNGGLYDTVWEYTPSTNSYKRWVGNNADIDQETNTQVTAKVVVIQETKMFSANDDKGRIIIDTIGQGDATILIDGNKIDGSWKKANRLDRTTFYDADGNEIEFNRGRIWISVISQSWGEFDIIEQ